MTSTQPLAVDLRGVIKRYGDVAAVDHVDLTIPAGRRVALLGLNGAGKTTTISMILGLIQPTAGEIRVFGHEPREAIQRGQVGAMLQSSRVPPRATVADVARLACRLYDQSPTPAELLERTGLTSLAGRRVERLSGGEAQRVKFALASAGQPDLIMLDEPTTAMDVPSRLAFWQQMRDVASTGRTIIFCTHLMEEAADADEVIVMRAGRVVAAKTPQELLSASRLARVSVSVDVPDAQTLPGVQSVERADGRTTLSTSTPDDVVYALASSGLLQDLRIDHGTLESAFLELAGSGPMTAATTGGR